MITLVELAAAAVMAGVKLSAVDGELKTKGPKSARSLARAIHARKADVLRLVDHIDHGLGLDWHDAPFHDPGQLCVLCGRKAFLADPYDKRPMHKTCAEAVLRDQPLPAAHIPQPHISNGATR